MITNYLMQFRILKNQAAKSLKSPMKTAIIITSKDEYITYEIEKKIPKTPFVSIPCLPYSISPLAVSLRCSIISTYGRIIENMMVSYTLSGIDDSRYDNTNCWKSSSLSDEKPQSQYTKQIIGPAYSISTKNKLEFINNILKNEKEENCELNLIFNGFEADKFRSNYESDQDSNNNESENGKNSVFARPLFVQLME